MDELGPFVESHFMEMSLYEIFHSLHVMVGGLFDFLDLHCLFRSEIEVDVPHLAELAPVNVSELWQRNFAERNEILDFHAHAVLYQCKFAEIFSQRFGFGCVAAVNR